jgi:hypothetical protein
MSRGGIQKGRKRRPVHVEYLALKKRGDYHIVLFLFYAAFISQWVKKYVEGWAMIERTYDVSREKNRLLTLLGALLAFFLLAGCAGGNYGRLDRDKDLDKMFLNYEVLPDHRYYTSGGYDAPNAILAIHNDYELDNPGNLWVSVPNVDYAQMRKWVDTLAPEQNFRFSGSYFAAYILDPDGQKVGVWYAIESQATVKFFEGNKVQVYPPELNQNIYFNKGLRMRGGL